MSRLLCRVRLHTWQHYWRFATTGRTLCRWCSTCGERDEGDQVR